MSEDFFLNNLGINTNNYQLLDLVMSRFNYSYYFNPSNIVNDINTKVSLLKKYEIINKDTNFKVMCIYINNWLLFFTHSGFDFLTLNSYKNCYFITNSIRYKHYSSVKIKPNNEFKVVKGINDLIKYYKPKYCFFNLYKLKNKNNIFNVLFLFNAITIFQKITLNEVKLLYYSLHLKDDKDYLNRIDKMLYKNDNDEYIDIHNKNVLILNKKIAELEFK